MAITPANETDNLDAFGEEGTKNWYTPLSKLVLFVDKVIRRKKAEIAATPGIFETGQTGVEYISGEQCDGIYGTVYRQYVDQSGFTTGSLTNLITGISGASVLLDIVDFKFRNIQSSLVYNVESSSYAGDYCFLHAPNTTTIQSYVGSGWGTRFKGWVDYVKDPP